MIVEETRRLAAIAQALWDAEQSGIATAPLTAHSDPLDIRDAYTIQRINLARRFARGEQTIGHKVGLSSRAMQMQLGIDAPDFGVLTDAMAIPSQGGLDLDQLIAPRIEAEIAFRLSRAFPGWSRPSVGELASAISDVSLALEIIDSRVRNWETTLIDTVADNAACARIVVGPARRAKPAVLDELPGTRLTLMQDGIPVGEGLGSAALGDPRVALHWLAQALQTFGEGFHKGDVILTGAVHASVPLDCASTWSVVADDFDSVSLTTYRGAVVPTLRRAGTSSHQNVGAPNCDL
jgi:2-keto-4-pentenoate hydratase